MSLKYFWKLLIVFCFLIGVPLYVFALRVPPVQSNYVCTILKLMTKQERLQLDAFFKLLLFREQFAYVLYGDKPMSITEYVLKCEKGNLGGIRFSNLSMVNIILRNGWQVWQKYHHHFPSKNYVFHHFFEGENNVCILLINKKAFKQVFDKNRFDFISRYDADITMERMLEKCLSKDSISAPDFRDFHELQGLLFGYGKVNAHLFQKRWDLEKVVRDRPFASLNFHKEIEEIDIKLRAFENYHPSSLLLMHLPYFAADLKHEQTIILKKKYQKQRQSIAQHYKNGDFLELTLLQLME